MSEDGEQGHYAVTICHATRSAKNPYVVITVNASSISRLMSAIGNGHGGHTGAVFDPAVNSSGDNWGDIIPPVTNPRTGAVAFAGLNVGNVAWIARGCTAPTVDLTDTDSSSDTDGASDTGSLTTDSPMPGTISSPTTETNVAAPGTVAGSTADTNVAMGTVIGSTVSGATTGGTALPGEATIPTSVPAGDGSSLPASSLPSWALLAMLLTVMAAVAAGLGVIMTRGGAHLAQ